MPASGHDGGNAELMPHGDLRRSAPTSKNTRHMQKTLPSATKGFPVTSEAALPRVPAVANT
jgi:hypothetical protein